jgi:2-dehydropantoate 2-reductase
VKLAIVGVGAIGGAVAAVLARAHDVALVSRTPFDRLVVDDVPVRDVGRELAATTDWVLVCTKAYDAVDVAHHRRVAVLQNGVEHEVRYPGCVPVIVHSPASRSAPGVVRTRGPVKLSVRNDDAGRAFAALAPDVITCVEDFTTARWKKLCINVASVVTVLEDAPLGCLREERVAAIARALVAECVRVAVAEGARFADADEHARGVVAEMAAGDPGASPSILADWRARRPLEIDARNAVVARIGARHGIATPATDALLARVAALTRSRT